MPQAELPRKLGLLDSVAIVIGVVIGGGIFIVPNLVARSLPSSAWILACWIFAGAVSFFGALACAELGAALPATGGQYVFIRESYGPLAGFLCGWTTFLVARTAQVAWLAVTFMLFASYFVRLSPVAIKAGALTLCALFAAINYVGVHAGALVQRAFMFAKLAGLAVIIASAFLAPAHASAAPATTGPVTLSSFGVAMIACLLGYDGWVQMSFVAGEIRNPRRNILLALAMGVACTIVVYLLANLAYLRLLTIPEIAASDHVGAAAAERAMGPVGGTLISVLIMVSIIGTLNGCFLTSPRVYFAQARDGLFFRKFASVHPRFQTPGFAIVAQALWSAALVLTGSYDTLIDYAMFATWLFYGVMVAGVIVLRRRRPTLERPYKMWGYPWTALLFLAVTLWFLINTAITRPVPALAGLAFIATGFPVYWIWRKSAFTQPLRESSSTREPKPAPETT
ncbi:MAG: amino acid permease [Acidobacteriaceae bacterium]|nr:amino acid permease [Acidobacteriaceae bacterium]